MKRRIEKRWKALDQPLFVFALILNPYEGVRRFGDKANISSFTLNTEFLAFYRHVKSRPSSIVAPEVLANARQQAERAVSAAFMAYLSSSGPFQDWNDHQDVFEATHGSDPILVWEQFRANAATSELADFAIMLLGLVVNQAGAERSFSDLGIKKTQHRNRLRLPKLEKMSKVGADIKSKHVADGLVEDRKSRKNHSNDKVKSLLAVPSYADLYDGLGENEDDPDA
ncbi:hypothetical protein BDZ89DRAFT_1146368 [Hymenopellis radicata]|nr:hypothetical protein BDZ89DRAFT_1146368 [Hymenopellis radicata]